MVYPMKQKSIFSEGVPIGTPPSAHRVKRYTLRLLRNELFDTAFMMMCLEDVVLEFMKVVSLFWIWIQTNDYTDQADSIDKHEGLLVQKKLAGEVV